MQSCRILQKHVNIYMLQQTQLPGASGSSLLLLAGQLLLLLAGQQQQQQQQHAAWTASALVRQFSDAPEPLIVPLKKQQTAPAAPDRNKGPWERVQDKATGATYWWNPSTGATTPVGAPKPDAWVAVEDKQTGLTYYWNQDSGDTTAVGEPLPGPEGRMITAAAGVDAPRPSAAQVLGNSLAIGFGVGLVFGLIRLFV